MLRPLADSRPVSSLAVLQSRLNQGLPKTLYIAPWKRVGTPLEAERLEGTFSEEIDPLEPDLFQRELELHREGFSVD